MNYRRLSRCNIAISWWKLHISLLLCLPANHFDYHGNRSLIIRKLKIFLWHKLRESRTMWSIHKSRNECMHNIGVRVSLYSGKRKATWFMIIMKFLIRNISLGMLLLLSIIFSVFSCILYILLNSYYFFKFLIFGSNYAKIVKVKNVWTLGVLKKMYRIQGVINIFSHIFY